MAFLPALSTITKATALAKLVSEVKTLLFGSSKPKEVTSTRRSGPKDTTKFTDYHIAVIKAEYDLFVINNQTNPKKRMTQAELASKLNEKLGLNKSRQSYAAVWNSKE